MLGEGQCVGESTSQAEGLGEDEGESEADGQAEVSKRVKVRVGVRMRVKIPANILLEVHSRTTRVKNGGPLAFATGASPEFWPLALGRSTSDCHLAALEWSYSVPL